MKHKDFIKDRRFVGWALAVVALIIAGTYLAIVPPEAYAAKGVPKVVLLYAHSLSWIFLSACAATWAWGGRPKLTSALAYGALAMYAVFWLALIYVRSML